MMLIYNPVRVMALRGIERTFKFLSNHGFVHSTASNMIAGRLAEVKIKHIGKLCLLLNCTPNDLFEWKPDPQSPLPEDHALNAIVREAVTMKNIKEMLKDIPIEKIPEIENLLKGLKDS